VTAHSIISRYVFREISGAFVLCFAVFLFAGLVVGFLPLLQKFMDKGLKLTLVLFQVLMYALPGTLVTIFPLSLTIGILLGLGRMASDNEIAAIKSAGISVYRLLPPVLLLGLIACLLSLVSTLVLIPKGLAENRKILHEAATKRADAGLEERTFFDSLQNLIVYVDRIDSATRVLSNVFIQESSDPNEVKTIVAREGLVGEDAGGKALVLNLFSGTIIRADKAGDTIGTLAFEKYVFRYPLDKAGLQASTASFEELSIGEINRRVEEVTGENKKDVPNIEAYHKKVRLFARILITQRFVYPLACLALAMTAFPLGVLYLGKGRLNNVSIGLFAVFLYYAVTLATERLARSDLAAPELILPLPPLLFMLLSAYFTRCVNMERLPGIVRFAQVLISRFNRR
jgi:lipopolysaccharide export system permease protein